MTEPEPEHARPGPGDMLAALAAARAVVDGDDQAAHEYASAACPACVAVAGTSLGIKLAFDLAGDALGPHAAGPIRLAILGALASIESQLRAEGN
jgi:hypothetical protein